MRRRERELMGVSSAKEAGQGSAPRASPDVQRKQIEPRAHRRRTTSSHSDDAAQQFALIKSSRRMPRACHRARPGGQVFRRGESGARRLAHVGDAGAQLSGDARRCDRRARAQTTSGSVRSTSESRVSRPIFAGGSRISADAEAERAVIEARLQGSCAAWNRGCARAASALITDSNVLRPANTWRVRRREDEPTTEP